MISAPRSQPDRQAGGSTPEPIADPPLSRWSRFVGNASVLLLLAAIAMFWAWRWYIDLPAPTEVHLLDGRVVVTLAQIGSFFNVVLGFLGGIGVAATLSRAGLLEMLSELFTPLNLIEDPTVRRRLTRTPVLLFALACLGFAVAVTRGVSVISVEAEYEMTAQLAPGSAARFVVAEGAEPNAVRLSRGAAARLAVSGPSVLYLRDKYGLVTLEAFGLDRAGLGPQVRPCQGGSADGANPDMPEAELVGLLKRGQAMRAVDELRWAASRVSTPLVLADGSYSDGSWIRPGEARDGPERGAPPWAQRYLDRLYEERQQLADWHQRRTYRRGDAAVVSLAIDGYDLEIVYFERPLRCPGFRALSVRDAVTIRAVERQHVD
jgi:hypothetical protein